MRTAKNLVADRSVLYECELLECAACNTPLSKCNYRSGRKVVQSLDEVLAISYQPYRCMNPECAYYGNSLRSAGWLQMAPLYCTYAFDVIAQIGWLRQTARLPFDDIHAQLASQVLISESEVRHLYYDRYLPLLACYERLSMQQLQQVAQTSGLLLTLDGLAPQGGEPQLWVVRELRTGLTLRAGWLSRQTQAAFENFLQPIADLKLPISAILSDKQRGLPAAVAKVFINTPHAFCQSHYLKNLAEPIAAVDQQLKVTMRKTIRKQVGELIRQEDVESPGVLTVTGLIPSPIEDEADMMPIKQAECDIQIESSEQLATTSQIECGVQAQMSGATATKSQVDNCRQDEMVNYALVEAQNRTNQTPHPIATDLWQQVDSNQQILRTIKVTVDSDSQDQAQSDVQAGASVYEFEVESKSSENVQQERNDIIADLTRRVRYLLTLKGRPPFLLAGLEMFSRLSEVVSCVEIMILHEADSRLLQLCEGIKVGINEVCDQMQELSIAAGWLRDISDLLDPEGKPSRTAVEVNQELSNYLRNLRTGELTESLDQIADQLQKTTNNYSVGLFVSYDVIGLPRTNNERESEFRLLTSRLLRTTGQKGATIRLIQKVGAWELIPHPSSFKETVAWLSEVDQIEFQKERQRLRSHRARFKSHTRSVKQSRKLLNSLLERWINT